METNLPIPIWQGLCQFIGGEDYFLILDIFRSSLARCRGGIGAAVAPVRVFRRLFKRRPAKKCCGGVTDFLRLSAFLWNYIIYIYIPWCWTIYQHLSQKLPKCRQIYNEWSIWWILVDSDPSPIICGCELRCQMGLAFRCQFGKIKYDIWLVVEPPLWKILVSWDDYSQYMEK